ncbi:MAG: hypothetical protein E7018_02620 [Alphaproteobacteria bacterium]|nr:hypothetical protein [Alphaproteobacteria bacterium]
MIVIVVITTIMAIDANAQNDHFNLVTDANAQNNYHFKKVDGANNGNNCGQVSAIGEYQYINGEGLFGFGVEGAWNHKCLKIGADYIFAQKGYIDRSSASAFIGLALTGPRSKVRPIVLAHVGGASQSKYCAYKTNVAGSTPSADIEMNFIHLYKSYDWNFQTRLEFRVEWIVSNTITLAAFVKAICNPSEGRYSETTLKDIVADVPKDQNWVVNANNIQEHTEDDIFGGSGGFCLVVRF